MKTKHRHKQNLKTKAKTKKRTKHTSGIWYGQTAWFGMIHFSGHTIEQAVDDMLAKFNASAAAYFANPPQSPFIPINSKFGPTYTRNGPLVRVSSSKYTQKIDNGRLTLSMDYFAPYPDGYPPTENPNYPDWTVFELFVYPPRNGSVNLGWVPP